MKFLTFLALSLLTLMNSAIAQQQAEQEEKVINYVYEHPSIEKITQLYWTLGKFDLKDDAAVDFYMMVNECDLYRDYFHNELEWKSIRESGRDFLGKNKNKFPLRFEITQPLKLGEYNIEKSSFAVQEDYQIKGIRRFEVIPENIDAMICGMGKIESNEIIDNYPDGLLVELSRPILLSNIEVNPELAKEYLNERMKKFKNLRPMDQTSTNLHNMRDAYLVMKIKFFAFEGDIRSNKMNEQYLSKVLGILEGIEVYADPKKKNLLYSEDYRRKKKRKKIATQTGDSTSTKPMLLDTKGDVSTLGSPLKN